MATRDTGPIKNEIISVIKQRGPSLPVHISGKVGQSMLFTSAFLSELISEGRLKTSNMRVGSSPIYYLPEQKKELEKYSQYLKSKEKEAYELLKEKKFLKDSEQVPAIRVALRSIKDFAISFEREGEIYWKYFTEDEEKLENKSDEKSSKEIPSHTESTIRNINEGEKMVQNLESKNTEKNTEEEESENNEKEESENNEKEESKNTEKKTNEELDIFENSKENQKENFEKDKNNLEKQESQNKEINSKKSKKRKSKSSGKNDKFFNKVKKYLKEKNIEILDIEGIGKSDLTLKVQENGKENILVAINKKRIDESDLQKAHKKAKDFEMPFIILCNGGPLKRLQNTLDALKKLSKIEGMD